MNGADIDAQDHFGQTALDRASESGFSEVVNYLIENEIRVCDGRTYISAEALIKRMLFFQNNHHKIEAKNRC